VIGENTPQKGIADNWLAVAGRGAVAVLVGIALLFLPHVTFALVMIGVAAYVLVDGVLALVVGFAAIRSAQGRWFVLEGLAGILLAIAILIYPHVASEMLLYTLAVWAVVTGILEFAIAVDLRQRGESSRNLFLAAALSIGLAILLYAFLHLAVAVLAWIFAGYAIFFGMTQIGSAVHLRSQPRAVSPRSNIGG
jgi:uncharacterized membrane protein HdeD (DUF308 family)